MLEEFSKSDILEQLDKGFAYASVYGPLIYKEVDPATLIPRFIIKWNRETKTGSETKHVVSLDFDSIFSQFVSLCLSESSFEEQ